MCLPGQLPAPPSPACAADAVAMARAGLAWLAAADAASVPAAVQADCLRALEQAESVHTAARAKVLAAFHAGGGYGIRARVGGDVAAVADPDHQRAAAGGDGVDAAAGRPPAVADALAAGDVSVSWARAVCAWTDLLPAECRADADVILLAARPAARSWRTWPGWPRRCAAGPRGPTPTGMTGSPAAA